MGVALTHQRILISLRIQMLIFSSETSIVMSYCFFELIPTPVMKTITIEEDVYDHIMDQVASSGQDPSAVLRDELGIPTPSENRPENGEDERQISEGSRELEEYLDSSRPEAHSTAAGRYLAILSEVYDQNADLFEEVEERVTGQSRKYFSKSADELASSGSSVNPKQIPGTPYYATTNNSTSKKQERIERVLRLLGYDDRVIQKARRAI